MGECRKQFEREVDSFGWSLERTEDGYTTATTEAAWWGWEAAYQAGMREAAQLLQDMDCSYVAGEILKAAKRVEAGE